MAGTAHRLQILAAALLFSTGGTAIKACSLSSWQIAGYRSGLAALALLVALPAGRRCWRPGPLVVGVTYATTLVLFVTANRLTTAANTIFLQSTAPIWVLLIGARLLGEPVRAREVRFTLALGLGMALFFVGVEPPRATATAPLLGNVLGTVAGLTWAATLVGLRWLGRGARGAQGAAEASVVAGNLVAFAVCLPRAWPLPQATVADWTLVGYLGLFQIGLAYVFLTRAVRHLPALEISLLILLEPVLSALWAWLFHAERPGAWSLAGCGVILAATLAHAFAREKPARAEVG